MITKWKKKNLEQMIGLSTEEEINCSIFIKCNCTQQYKE